MDEEIKKEFEKIWEKINEISFKLNPLTLQADILIETKKTSLREFFNAYKISSELDKVLIIIYYYEKFKGMNGITTKEEAEGFREIREKMPSNMADKFQKLTKKGFIMPSGKTEKLNSWTYTNSGEDYINSIKK